MREKLDEMHQDIKEIKNDVRMIDITLARNTESLVQHEKRTTLSENRIHSLERWHIGILTSGLLALVGVVIKLVL